MKSKATAPTQRLIKASLTLCALAALMTFGDWLALHDIRHDYVSRSVIESSLGGWDARIPDWSATPTEWRTVEVSAIVRIVCFGVSAFTLVTVLRERYET